MARKLNPVRLEDGIHWLVAKLAAEKSGLTKPELARRALAGDLRYKADQYGMPVWYAEPDIDPLRKAELVRKQERQKKTPRSKSAKQLEREWNSTPAPISFEGGGRGGRTTGSVAGHFEKVMLAEIHQKKKVNKD